MRTPRVLALILAGGQGGRLGDLTRHRAKPTIPFGGTHRLIDFALSNCMHSRLGDVWIVEQYLPHSLNDHLANGRPWDLDRTYGGLQVLPPYQGTEGEGFAEGNADALGRHLPFLREFGPDVVVTLSADHVYRLDLREVVEAHTASGAGVTLVTKELPGEDVRRYGVLVADSDGLVREFAYKSDSPPSHNVATEVIAYDAPTLFEALDLLMEGEEGAKDYGNRLVPHLVERGVARSFPMSGYWRDVGTLESYWQGHMDLIDQPDAIDLSAPDWPIVTLASQRVAARVRAGATVEDSLLAPGAEVAGTVRRSVLAGGATVEAGAAVEESVLLEGAKVLAGGVVRRAILDRGTVVGAGESVIGGDEPALRSAGERFAPRSAHRPLA